MGRKSIIELVGYKPKRSPIRELKVSIGINTISCRECSDNKISMRLLSMFKVAKKSANSMFAYDDEKQEIIVFEDDLMKAIQLVVPNQKIKPIRIEKGSALEWRKNTPMKSVDAAEMPTGEENR